LIEKETFKGVGGFDTEKYSVTLNDVAICLRTRKLGLKVIYTPNATLIHHELQSRPSDERGSETIRRKSELKNFSKEFSNFDEIFYTLHPTHRRDNEKITRI
jgi:GT2 family glycosyltransferase